MDSNEHIYSTLVCSSTGGLLPVMKTILSGKVMLRSSFSPDPNPSLPRISSTPASISVSEKPSKLDQKRPRTMPSHCEAGMLTG